MSIFFVSIYLSKTNNSTQRLYAGQHTAFNEAEALGKAIQCDTVANLIQDGFNIGLHLTIPCKIPAVENNEHRLQFFQPKCTSCHNRLTDVEIKNTTSGLCFDCEKKTIIQAADNFNPTSCMVCKGEFDNPLQKQLGICGKCMKKAADGPDPVNQPKRRKITPTDITKPGI